MRENDWGGYQDYLRYCHQIKRLLCLPMPFGRPGCLDHVVIQWHFSSAEWRIFSFVIAAIAVTCMLCSLHFVCTSNAACDWSSSFQLQECIWWSVQNSNRRLTFFTQFMHNCYTLFSNFTLVLVLLSVKIRWFLNVQFSFLELLLLLFNRGYFYLDERCANDLIQGCVDNSGPGMRHRYYLISFIS